MGLTVLDAGIVIGLLDGDDLHHRSARTALQSAIDRGDHLSLPASEYAACLVDPSRHGETAIAAVDALVKHLPVSVVPIDQTTAATAAQLRATHGGRLKLPEALVVATAMALEADVLLTTGRDWPSRRVLGFSGKLVAL